MIIDNNISINEKYISFNFIRSDGPGGQNVNKVSTAVELRYDIKSDTSLSDDIKEKLYKSEKNKISSDYILIITAKRFRYQERNREDALLRLKKIITAASIKTKIRRKTNPSKISIENRLNNKKIKSLKKTLRNKVDI